MPCEECVVTGENPLCGGQMRMLRGHRYEKRKKKSWHINVKRDVERAGEDKEGCQVDFFSLFYRTVPI